MSSSINLIAMDEPSKEDMVIHRFQHLSGTRGHVDFVEFPSHLLEFYALDQQCLSAYAGGGVDGRR